MIAITSHFNGMESIYRENAALQRLRVATTYIHVVATLIGLAELSNSRGE
jgi:hypothetical protein